MICSKCQYDDAERSDRLDRYLCVEGHLICVSCIRKIKDRGRRCPVCGSKIVKKLNVIGTEVPRLEIREVDSRTSICKSSEIEEMVQLEPCKTNFEQLQSIEGVEPPLHYSRGSEIEEPILIDLSSDDSRSDILRNGRMYFSQTFQNEEENDQNPPKLQEKCPNHISSSQFPFKVSFDSIEINKDPRERQICNLYDTLPPEHEHVIAVNSYNEPCALPYIVIETQETDMIEGATEVQESFPVQEGFVPEILNQENFLQFFRVLNDSYVALQSQRDNTVDHTELPILNPNSVASSNKNDDQINQKHEERVSKSNNLENVLKREQKPLTTRSCIKSATSLSISRAPILCPISTCSKLEFKSQIIKHIQTDHPRILLETISSGVEKVHFWDTRANKRDTSKCHVVYLLRDRIRDLGSTEFKNYLPILVMTTKFKTSSSLFGNSLLESKENKEKSHFMIWLTGLTAKEIPVSYTLTLFSERMETPAQKIVFCNEIYSWRKEQTPAALYESGNALILTHQQHTQLTRNGKEMIRMKIVID